MEGLFEGSSSDSAEQQPVAEDRPLEEISRLRSWFPDAKATDAELQELFRPKSLVTQPAFASWYHLRKALVAACEGSNACCDSRGER